MRRSHSKLADGNSAYQSWTLDQQGNWSVFDGQGRTFDTSNETTALGSTSTTQDPDGNTTFDGTYNYVYDAWNRLVCVSTTGAAPVVVATYAYDGNGNRIQKTAGGVTTDYYYNTSDQVLEERVGGLMTYQYVWDIRFVNAPICRFDSSGNAIYYTEDANFNVTALVSGATGNVIERYVYDAYGNFTIYTANWTVMTTQQSTVGNEILYTGDRVDLETAVYNTSGTMTSVNYFSNARELSTLYQWLQRDPAQSSTNLYQYVSLDPTFCTDPSGLWKFNRDGATTARATAECGDTIGSLAQIVGLDADQWRKWATLVEIRDIWSRSSLSPTKRLHPGDVVEVPNTVLTYWGGALGAIGKWWVQWYSDVATLRQRGFDTQYMDVNNLGGPWTQNRLQEEERLNAFVGDLNHMTASKQLQGIYFWGHGGFSLYCAPLNPFVGKVHAARFMGTMITYRLGLGIIWGCDTLGTFRHRDVSAASLEPLNVFTNTKGAIEKFHEGLLLPLPFHAYGDPVGTIVPPGAQGTRE